MEFLDRVDESRRLLRFVQSAEGGIACVYGRRRIGKSRLLDEVLGKFANVVSYCADRSEPALQRARMAQPFNHWTWKCPTCRLHINPCFNVNLQTIWKRKK